MANIVSNNPKKNLPIYTQSASFVYDTESIEESIGMVDYVFIGRVTSEEKTEYQDVSEVTDESGNKIKSGEPYTIYNVKVLKNIKGDLKDNITIKKEGGIMMDKSAVVLFENDVLPEVKQKYMFLAYAQEDGSLLVSGPNSNICLNDKNMKKIAQKYEKAFKNERKLVERKRYLSKYEKMDYSKKTDSSK